MTQALLAISAVLAFGLAAAVYVLMTRRRKPEPEFDGGFRHDNRPRAITRIRCNDMDWEIR